MYEQHFKKFVAFLFPNDLLDESILDFIEGEMAMDDMAAYRENFGVDLFKNDDARMAVLSLLNVLDEMRKNHPKKDLIDYYLDDALNLLRNFNPPNIGHVKSFRSFLLFAEAKKSGLLGNADEEGWQRID